MGLFTKRERVSFTPEGKIIRTTPKREPLFKRSVDRRELQIGPQGPYEERPMSRMQMRRVERQKRKHALDQVYNEAYDRAAANAVAKRATDAANRRHGQDPLSFIFGPMKQPMPKRRSTSAAPKPVVIKVQGQGSGKKKGSTKKKKSRDPFDFDIMDNWGFW